MAIFKVVEIIDGDTIKVTPRWKIKRPNGEVITGDTLRIFGYVLPKAGTDDFIYAKLKLQRLLQDKEVSLKNPSFLPTSEAKNALITCRVTLNDVDVSYYFPEFRIQ